jgi:hypothetical protein
MRNPGTRRVDGKPETEADSKFFDLRQSGYKGPIDEDGNKVTSGDEAEILADLWRRAGRK